ncbi:hypothetical protein VNI00_003765 [Paramarasmius palmivorus]|uniref:Uncharacterized protein n=1 Tax=Paramarasmius palmivorus TaxID=297713 RepID=A0AAW0DQB6_9AGAR
MATSSSIAISVQPTSATGFFSQTATTTIAPITSTLFPAGTIVSDSSTLVTPNTLQPSGVAANATEGITVIVSAITSASIPSASLAEPIGDSGSSSNLGIVVGSVLGGMVLGLLLAGLIWLCCRRRRRMLMPDSEVDQDERINDLENIRGHPAPPRNRNNAATEPLANHTRIMNWLARMNSQRSSRRAARSSRSQTTEPPPEYKSVLSGSDTESLHPRDPFADPRVPSSATTTTAVESQRQPDFVAYDITHLKT